MKVDDLKNRINQLIASADNIIANRQDRAAYSDGKYRYAAKSWVDNEEFQEFRSASTSFIGRVYGTDNVFYTDFVARVKSNTPTDAISGRGILKAIKQEIDGGWLFTVKGLVSAELFTDFLEMASHLLQEGYKDPAAVMIGSVLEEHLRQLCLVNEIDTALPDPKSGKEVPKKADRMNNDLMTKGVYNKLQHKNIISWLSIRNYAAHGHYTEYGPDDVKYMEEGVANFIGKTIS